MVGIFTGAQTAVVVDGTFTWIPTRGPKVVIVTLRPGSRTPPPALAGAPIVGFPTTTGGGVVPVASTPGTIRNCPTPVAPQFAGAFAKFGAIGDRIGCPTKPAFGLKLVSQTFQNGAMFWRETKEMFALTSANTYIRVMDTWNETLPANDPSLTPPAGLLQPVRGFGYAWRSNPGIRNGLGWATGNEQQFDGTWQDFERGFMITGLNGTVYALIPVTPDGGQHLGTLTN
jgi:serine/threonine-protein kinase